MARSSIESEVIDSIDDLKNRIALLTAIEGGDLPDTLSEARKKGWILAVDALFITVSLHYPDDERNADKQRVVPVDAVMRAIDDLEEKLVKDYVVSPFRLADRRARAASKIMEEIREHSGGLFVSVLQGIGKFWTALNTEGEDPIENLEPLIEDLSKTFAAIKAAAKVFVFLAENQAIQVALFDVFKLRNERLAAVRKRVLPQPQAKRYRRRKIARL